MEYPLEPTDYTDTSTTTEDSREVTLEKEIQALEKEILESVRMDNWSVEPLHTRYPR